MKQRIVLTTIAAIILAFSACMKDTATIHYKLYQPIKESMTDIRNKIAVQASQDIVTPGKIAVIGNYLFVTEQGSGIHIINNSNPAAPVNESFIAISGNQDVSVRGNYLYADCYTDLIVFDISNKSMPKKINFIPDVFKDKRYNYGYYADSGYIVTGLTERDTTITIDADIRTNYWYYSNGNAYYMSDNATTAPGYSTSTTNSTSGSMARFALVNDRLYTVESYYLSSFNVSNPAMPVATGRNPIGSGIETIYPFKDKLFIGSQSGMIIYDITNPDKPTSTGSFSHARLCDPVITDGNYAYITLHSSTNICIGTDNELDVVDVNNLQSPVLIKKYNMTKPMGLGKDNNHLFVCDDGLKVYDATNPKSLTLLKTINVVEPYDVICINGLAIVSATDGLYQYSYTDINNITQLSKINISKK